jgi:hypothetical protein
MCVAAVLGGREGMPWSLGSVYGGSVTRFLGGGCRGVVSRVIDTPGLKSFNNDVAVSRDGSTLLVSDWDGGSHAMHSFRVVNGSQMARSCGAGDGPLQFKTPRPVWAASDGFVFMADYGNGRVQVPTPRHRHVGCEVMGQRRGGEPRRLRAPGVGLGRRLSRHAHVPWR